MISLYAVLRSCDNGECDTVIEKIFTNRKDAENCLIRRYMARHMDFFDEWLYDDDGDEDIQCTDCSCSLINNLLDIYYFNVDCEEGDYLCICVQCHNKKQHSYNLDDTYLKPQHKGELNTVIEENFVQNYAGSWYIDCEHKVEIDEIKNLKVEIKELKNEILHHKYKPSEGYEESKKHFESLL